MHDEDAQLPPVHCADTMHGAPALDPPAQRETLHTPVLPAPQVVGSLVQEPPPLQSASASQAAPFSEPPTQRANALQGRP